MATYLSVTEAARHLSEPHVVRSYFPAEDRIYIMAGGGGVRRREVCSHGEAHVAEADEADYRNAPSAPAESAEKLHGYAMIPFTRAKPGRENPNSGAKGVVRR